jgi:hypothetical protein
MNTTCDNENNHVNTSIAPTTTSYEDQEENDPGTNNVKMTMADARSELESNGFVIMEPPQELQHASSHFLVAYRKECYVWLRLDTLVFVQELESDIPLTESRIIEDMKKLKTDWMLSLPPSFYSPSGCPAHGVYRGRQILMIYLSQHPILSHMESRLTQKPPYECCQSSLVFVAAQDCSNGASYYYNESPPFWRGRELYPGLRYWAGLLTGRRPLPEKPKKYKLVAALLLIISIIILLVVFPPTRRYGIDFWLFVILVQVACFLCGYAYQECQLQRQRHHIPWNTMRNENSNNII